jgi:hypothetical protein
MRLPTTIALAAAAVGTVFAGDPNGEFGPDTWELPYPNTAGTGICDFSSFTRWDYHLQFTCRNEHDAEICTYIDLNKCYVNVDGHVQGRVLSVEWVSTGPLKLPALAVDGRH